MNIAGTNCLACLTPIEESFSPKTNTIKVYPLPHMPVLKVCFVFGCWFDWTGCLSVDVLVLGSGARFVFVLSAARICGAIFEG